MLSQDLDRQLFKFCYIGSSAWKLGRTVQKHEGFKFCYIGSSAGQGSDKQRVEKNLLTLIFFGTQKDAKSQAISEYLFYIF